MMNNLPLSVLQVLQPAWCCCPSFSHCLATHPPPWRSTCRSSWGTGRQASRAPGRSQCPSVPVCEEGRGPGRKRRTNRRRASGTGKERQCVSLSSPRCRPPGSAPPPCWLSWPVSPHCLVNTLMHAVMYSSLTQLTLYVILCLQWWYIITTYCLKKFNANLQIKRWVNSV